jgi:hypothetical protein
MNDPELSDIPVVILSAHANIDQVLDDLSVDAKLSKPVEIAPLLALVNQHCSEAEAKEQALTL